MPAVEALSGRIGERRVENQIVATQRPAFSFQPVQQRRPETLAALRFVDDEIVDVEEPSVDEVLEDAESGERERTRFRPRDDDAIAALGLAPPARLEVVGRGEARPKLPHQREAGADFAGLDRSD